MKIILRQNYLEKGQVRSKPADIKNEAIATNVSVCIQVSQTPVLAECCIPEAEHVSLDTLKNKIDGFIGHVRTLNRPDARISIENNKLVAKGKMVSPRRLELEIRDTLNRLLQQMIPYKTYNCTDTFFKTDERGNNVDICIVGNIYADKYQYMEELVQYDTPVSQAMINHIKHSTPAIYLNRDWNVTHGRTDRGIVIRTEFEIPYVSFAESIRKCIEMVPANMNLQL